ncbi:tetratricopeptide repeat protein [Pseudoruegeria aquimaris]|uniref:Tetratricopeptide repeat protein n=1 Tax=Pseudoruegeria aquimaris TaxID=393663 RepID=A0A1Y5TKN5_9RHOB|nr:tetratricopeptide repeat-containing sulfotransferase family protein [Pseudoruegeria aquimaris]SLN66288.1 tetratricopeptide repeat protein [Pseudoruegeria aquimaris]
MTLPRPKPAIPLPIGHKQALVRLLQAGRIADARQQAETLARLHPQDGFCANVLGLAAQMEGDTQRALDHFARAVALAPEVADFGANLGYALNRSLRHQAAEAALRRVLRHHPRHVNARTNLVQALVELKRPEEAVRHALALIRHMGETPEALRVLGVAQAQAGDDRRGRHTLERALAGDPPRFEEYALLARCIENEDGPEAAIRRLRDIVFNHPEAAFAQMELGNRLAQSGDLEAAETAYRAALAANPSLAHAFLGLGRLRPWCANDPLLPALKALARNTGQRPDHRADALFALAKALEDIGDHDAGFEATMQANGLLRGLVNYDCDANIKGMSELPNVKFRPLARQHATAPQAAPRPIFILALPRSGTTLLEHILARHPDVTALGEDDTVHLHAIRAMETGNLATLARAARSHHARMARGRPVVTDKFLENGLCVPALAEALPDARFVYIRKDARAAGYSLLRSPLPPKGHPYTMDQVEVARYVAAHHRLMQVWMGRYADRFTEVVYENLVETPQTQIPALLERLELPPCADCLAPEQGKRPVKTLSLAQVRRGISTRYRDRWQAHAEALAPMCARLAAEGAPVRPR